MSVNDPITRINYAKSTVELTQFSCSHSALILENNRQTTLKESIDDLENEIKNSTRSTLTDKMLSDVELINKKISSNQEALQFFDSISSLEELFSQISTELSDRSFKNSLHSSTTEFEANVSIQKVKQCWSQIKHFSELTSIHTKNASDYHEFYHECSEIRLLIEKRWELVSKQINNLYLKGTMKDAKEIVKLIKEMMYELQGIADRIRFIKRHCLSIVPVYLRSTSIKGKSKKAFMLADIRIGDLQLKKGDEILLLDNWGKEGVKTCDETLDRLTCSRINWLIKTSNGDKVLVPSVAVWIPGPDSETILVVNELQKQLSSTWEELVEQIKYKLYEFIKIFFQSILNGKDFSCQNKDLFKKFIKSILSIFTKDYKEIETELILIIKQLENKVIFRQEVLNFHDGLFLRKQDLIILNEIIIKFEAMKLQQNFSKEETNNDLQQELTTAMETNLRVIKAVDSLQEMQHKNQKELKKVLEYIELWKLGTYDNATEVITDLEPYTVASYTSNQSKPNKSSPATNVLDINNKISELKVHCSFESNILKSFDKGYNEIFVSCANIDKDMELEPRVRTINENQVYKSRKRLQLKPYWDGNNLRISYFEVAQVVEGYSSSEEETIENIELIEPQRSINIEYTDMVESESEKLKGKIKEKYRKQSNNSKQTHEISLLNVEPDTSKKEEIKYFVNKINSENNLQILMTEINALMSTISLGVQTEKKRKIEIYSVKEIVSKEFQKDCLSVLLKEINVYLNRTSVESQTDGLYNKKNISIKDFVIETKERNELPILMIEINSNLKKISTGIQTERLRKIETISIKEILLETIMRNELPILINEIQSYQNKKSIEVQTERMRNIETIDIKDMEKVTLRRKENPILLNELHSVLTKSNQLIQSESGSEEAIEKFNGNNYQRMKKQENIDVYNKLKHNDICSMFSLSANLKDYGLMSKSKQKENKNTQCIIDESNDIFENKYTLKTVREKVSSYEIMNNNKEKEIRVDKKVSEFLEDKFEETVSSNNNKDNFSSYECKCSSILTDVDIDLINKISLKTIDCEQISSQKDRRNRKEDRGCEFEATIVECENFFEYNTKQKEIENMKNMKIENVEENETWKKINSSNRAAIKTVIDGSSCYELRCVSVNSEVLESSMEIATKNKDNRDKEQDKVTNPIKFVDTCDEGQSDDCKNTDENIKRNVVERIINESVNIFSSYENIYFTDDYEKKKKDQSTNTNQNDEVLCSKVTMVDIGTVHEMNLKSVSEAFEVDCISQNSEWKNEIKYEEKGMESSKMSVETISTSLEVQKCSIDVEFGTFKIKNIEAGHSQMTLMSDSDSLYETKMKNECTKTDFAEIINSGIVTEDDFEYKDIFTKYKVNTIDANSEYQLQAAKIEVGFVEKSERRKFEENMIEVSTEVFGEKSRTTINNLSVYEEKREVEDMCSEYICDMTEYQKEIRVKCVEESYSNEEVKFKEKGYDFTSIVVEESSEYNLEFNDIGSNMIKNKQDISTETNLVEISTLSSSYEIIYKNVNYGNEDVEVLNNQTERMLSDELLCSDKNMCEIATVFETNIENACESFEVEYISDNNECKSKINFKEKGMESMKIKIKTASTSIEVEKCSIDVDFESSNKETLWFKKNMQKEEKNQTVEKFLSYKLNYVSVECGDQREIVEEIVAESEEEEKAELIRFEDQSVCFSILMTDMATVVESNIKESSEETEETYVEQISEWANVIQQNNKSVETERSELSNVELSSEIEYSTTEVQCDEKKQVFSESSFETRVMMMESFSCYEMQSGNQETECEKPILMDSAVSMEHEIESKEMCTEIKAVSVDICSDFSIERICVDVAYEKERDVVDFSGSAELKTIEIGFETFGEKTNVLIDCQTIHEAITEIEETSCEFICNVIECESQSEAVFVENSYSQVDMKVSDVGLEVKSMSVDSSSDYYVKYIETGMEVYTQTCEVETETIRKEILEESSSYELDYVSVDCDQTEIVEEIVAESEEEEKAELIRFEDESVCFSILMTDMATVVESNIKESSEETEETYVEQISEWANVIQQNNKSVETERSELSNVELSSEIEYSTTEVQCDEKKQVFSESSFETRVMMMESFSCYEMQSGNQETECEKPILMDSAVSMEHEIESKEMCTEIKAVSVDICSDFSIERICVDVAYEKERDVVDFSGSAELKTIEIGFETFGEKTNVLIDCQTIHEAITEIEETSCEFICNVIECESQSEAVFVENSYSQVDLSCIKTESDCYACLEIPNNSLNKVSELDIFMETVEQQESITFYNLLSMPASINVGFQVNILPICSDFSTNFNFEETFVHESHSTISGDDIISQHSFEISDEFEWSEFGIELNNVPVDIECQTLPLSCCNLSSCYELSLINSSFSTHLHKTDYMDTSSDFLVDNKEYILSYFQTNISSEMIRTIIEIVLESDHNDTFINERIYKLVNETCDFNEYQNNNIQNKSFVEESQNTEVLFCRSVYVQSDFIDFNEIVTSFGSPTLDYSCNIHELVHMNRTEEVVEVESTLLLNKRTETKTTEIHPIVDCVEYISVALETDYKEDLYMTVTDEIVTNINVEENTNFLSRIDLKAISDNETQTNFQRRSCAIQTTSSKLEMYSIITTADYNEEIVEILNINKNIQKIRNEERCVQTDNIDFSDIYWKKSIEELLETIVNSSNNDSINTHSYSQTEQYNLEESCSIMDINQEYLSMNDTFSSKLMKNYETIERDTLEESENFKIRFGELTYSTITESSQTNGNVLSDDSDSIFEDDESTNTRYTITTETIENNLSDVIDSSIPLPIDIKSVCHPSNNIRYPYNVALNRGWLDIKHGIYCNPSTLETMPIERAIQLKKIELTSERKCPNVRRFGLFKEKIIIKIEKLKVKNVLNTKTGDLYDEKIAKEIGILLDTGEFYDNEAKRKISFEEAVLGNYIEVYSDSEIIDSTVNSEINYKILNIRDTTTGKVYNFHRASEKGLVNLMDATFRDTERNRNVTYNEAIRRKIIEAIMIPSTDHLYIENNFE